MAGEHSGHPNHGRGLVEKFADFTKSFSEEEIKAVVLRLCADKAPGADDFLIFFYQEVLGYSETEGHQTSRAFTPGFSPARQTELRTCCANSKKKRQKMWETYDLLAW